MQRWYGRRPRPICPDDEHRWIGPSPCVFFTVGRFSVVRYPAGWSLPLVLLAGLLLATVVSRRGGWRQLPLGFVTTMLTALVTAVSAPA